MVINIDSSIRTIGSALAASAEPPAGVSRDVPDLLPRHEGAVYPTFSTISKNDPRLQENIFPFPTGSGVLEMSARFGARIKSAVRLSRLMSSVLGFEVSFTSMAHNSLPSRITRSAS